MKQLSPYMQRRVIAELNAGVSTRGIAAKLRISKVTVSRYRKMLNMTAVLCGCGIAVGHRGWCAWRYQRSRLRQAFIASWKRRKLRNSHGCVEELLKLSQGLDPTIRGQVLSEMYMRVFSGQYSLSDVKAILSDAKRLVAKENRGGWRESARLDAPIRGTDNLHLIDVLLDDSKSVEELADECGEQ